MKTFRNLLAVGLVAVAPAVMAADLGTNNANQDGALGYSLAELHAALPNIPKDQLPSIVFRIPTIHSIMRAYREAHPTQPADQHNQLDANRVN